ncbi:MAG: carbamate kinase [Thermoproteota archaeon]|nr:MAG: carbamate kinase [Candidatus Korarchaeota archaeon]RLG54415.1 MAG: carbamate kinase [Candidatus Korarchaeota archaeon]
MELVVVCLGGNALMPPVSRFSIEEQDNTIAETCKLLVKLVDRGYRLVIVHGNGPQVGARIEQCLAARELMKPFPLDVLDAETQGQIGYMIQKHLASLLASRRGFRGCVTVVTQVVVDPEDEAFKKPTKPVGRALSREEAEHLAREGWSLVEEVGRGYRRVVPSPKPVKVVETDAVRTLVEAGFIVVAGGGGGIPVVEADSKLMGAEAVIDKDRTAAKIAIELGADLLLILTDVDCVYVNFRKPGEKPIRRMTAKEARELLARGEFPPGNMGPKVEACIEFAEATGNPAAIGHLSKPVETAEGKAGTMIVP